MPSLRLLQQPMRSFNGFTFHPTRESSPVGKNQKRETFSAKILDRLGGFEGRIWVPDLTSLLDYLGKEGQGELHWAIQQLLYI